MCIWLLQSPQRQVTYSSTNDAQTSLPMIDAARAMTRARVFSIGTRLEARPRWVCVQLSKYLAEGCQARRHSETCQRHSQLQCHLALSLRRVRAQGPICNFKLPFNCARGLFANMSRVSSTCSVAVRASECNANKDASTCANKSDLAHWQGQETVVSGDEMVASLQAASTFLPQTRHWQGICEKEHSAKLEVSKAPVSRLQSSV